LVAGSGPHRERIRTQPYTGPSSHDRDALTPPQSHEGAVTYAGAPACRGVDIAGAGGLLSWQVVGSGRSTPAAWRWAHTPPTPICCWRCGSGTAAGRCTPVSGRRADAPPSCCRSASFQIHSPRLVVSHVPATIGVETLPTPV